MTGLEALEKLDHTLCMNSNEGNLKFGIDTYENPSCDCKDVDEMVDCLEIVKQDLQDLEEIKKAFKPVIQKILDNIDALKDYYNL